MSQSSGIVLDPARDEALYQQVFDQIVARIRSGAYPVGFRLPPTRALARDVGTHRNTVVRAYEDLEAAGFVHSTVGRGTFVAEQARSRPQATPTVQSSLPWATLFSRAADAEALGRFDRVAPTSVSRDAINLTRMQPSSDLLPEDLLRRCIDHVLRTLGSKALGYAPREGLQRLRGLIAEDLVRQGVPASAEDILITTGSQQGLDLLSRTFVNPGDTFLVEEATYSGAINILSAAGARLVGVPSDGEGPDPGALSRLSRAGAKGFYLMPNCNNPTGVCVSRERREAIVAWSHEAGVPIIEDDYFSDLCFEDRAMPPALRSLDGNVIYMGTFSKKLIPALRIGYVLCPATLRPRLLALKHTLDLGTSLLLQHALAEFLERGYLRAHLGRVVPEYRKRRDALEAALRQRLPARIQWRRPETGVVLWLPLSAPYTPEAVCEEAQRHGVLVSPSTLNAVDSRHPSGVRLAFCAEPVDRLVEGAKRLGQAFAAIDKRTRGNAGQGAVPALGLA